MDGSDDDPGVPTPEPDPSDAAWSDAARPRSPVDLPAASDLLYTALGLGVLALQGLQVRRRAVERQVREVWRSVNPPEPPG